MRGIAGPIARRIARGLGDHPWLDGPPLSEKHRIILEQWMANSLLPDAAQTIVDIVALQAALLLQEHRPEAVRAVVQEIDRQLDAVADTLSAREPLEALAARLRKQGTWRDATRRLESVLEERWSYDQAALSLLAGAQALLSDIGGASRLARVQQLAEQVIASASRSKSSELLSRTLQRTYEQTAEDYARLVAGLRLRPAAGLEERDVAVARDLAVAAWGQVFLPPVVSEALEMTSDYLGVFV